MIKVSTFAFVLFFRILSVKYKEVASFILGKKYISILKEHFFKFVVVICSNLLFFKLLNVFHLGFESYSLLELFSFHFIKNMVILVTLVIFSHEIGFILISKIIKPNLGDVFHSLKEVPLFMKLIWQISRNELPSMGKSPFVHFLMNRILNPGTRTLKPHPELHPGVPVNFLQF
jgi:hypothetical protein